MKRNGIVVSKFLSFKQANTTFKIDFVYIFEQLQFQ